MPDQKEGVMLGIMTPQGPICLCLTREGFTKFVQQLNSLHDKLEAETPIPKVFEDAFEKEE